MTDTAAVAEVGHPPELPSDPQERLVACGVAPVFAEHFLRFARAAHDYRSFCDAVKGPCGNGFSGMNVLLYLIPDVYARFTEEQRAGLAQRLAVEGFPLNWVEFIVQGNFREAFLEGRFEEGRVAAKARAEEVPVAEGIGEADIE